MTSIELSFGEKIFAATVLTSSILGCLASLLLVLLIRDMGKWNDFIYLVYYMTICQFYYDILLPSFAFPPTTTVTVLRGVALFTSAISYTISTVIAYTVFHILHFKVICDLSKWRWLVGLRVMGPPLVMMAIIITGICINDPVVLLDGCLMGTFIRISCASINIIFYCICKYHVYVLTNLRKDKLTNSDIAMRCLVERIKWYPLVQIFARIIPTIYNVTYGFNLGFFDSTKFQFYLSLSSFITSAFVPVGFLVVFLRMQPNAYNHAKSRIFSGFQYKKNPSLADSEIGNNSSSQYKNSSDSKKTQENNGTTSRSQNKVVEESEFDWDSRAAASVNMIRDNEESTFEDSESNIALTATTVSGSTLILNGSSSASTNRILPPVKISNLSWQLSPSQQLCETQIENLNDDELMSLATEINNNNRQAMDGNENLQ